MSKEEILEGIIEVLDELCEDSTIPKNIKIKFQEINFQLNDKCDISIKINKALHELDEITNDTNMQSYVRTQIWNIVSMLEKVNS